MSQNYMDSAQLLKWAASLIATEQRNRSYAQITVHIEAGRITRAKVERSEKPPNLQSVDAPIECGLNHNKVGTI